MNRGEKTDQKSNGREAKNKKTGKGGPGELSL